MSDKVRNHKDLLVWQKGRELVKMVYTLSATFPKEELYGLTHQMRRAVVSIPSNLAEGSARKSTQEFIRSVRISMGSAAELETQLLLANDLGFCDASKTSDIFLRINEINAMMRSLEQSLVKRKLGDKNISNSQTLKLLDTQSA